MAPLHLYCTFLVIVLMKVGDVCVCLTITVECLFRAGQFILPRGCIKSGLFLEVQTKKLTLGYLVAPNLDV